MLIRSIYIFNSTCNIFEHLKSIQRNSYGEKKLIYRFIKFVFILFFNITMITYISFFQRASVHPYVEPCGDAFFLQIESPFLPQIAMQHTGSKHSSSTSTYSIANYTHVAFLVASRLSRLMSLPTSLVSSLNDIIWQRRLSDFARAARYT